MPSPSELFEEWDADNILFLEETIWTSSIQQSDLSKARMLLLNNGFKHVDLCIVRPNNEDFGRIKWKYHYDLKGNCISTNYQTKIEVQSNHLKLIVGLIDKNDNQECQNTTLSVISTLRVIFGIPIARELVFVNSYTKGNPTCTTSSEEGFTSYFLTQSLNMFPNIENAKVKIIPVEACILLDKAFQQKYPIECFVLMWTAFESIIHSLDIPGNTNGLKRKNYFTNELKSELINDEAYRLHQDVRCNIFKEAKFTSAKDVEDENFSLYAILQLTIMEDCPERSKFLKSYEEILKTKKALAQN
jgi:hypothetical protein